MKTHNGHRSWNAWNVSLWIHNDELLYRYVTHLANHRKLPTNQIVTNFLNTCARGGYVKGGQKRGFTPDGAIYNRLSLKLAIDSLRE